MQKPRMMGGERLRSEEMSASRTEVVWDKAVSLWAARGTWWVSRGWNSFRKPAATTVLATAAVIAL